MNTGITYHVRRSGPTLDRRALLKAGAGLSLVPLVGCTSNSPSNASNQTGAQRDLSIAISDGIFTFDPPATTDIFTAGNVNSLIYESLYRLDPLPPRTDLTPQLAVDMPKQMNDTKYRVQLRKDAVFHNGSQFTAEDVVFTINRYLDPEAASFFARFFEPIFKDARVISDDEVEIELKAPTTLLAHRLAILKIVSKEALEADPESAELDPVGTGPYMITSAVSHEEANLQKFEEYSGGGDYNFNKISVSVTADENARIAGLRSNRFQLIHLVPESAYEGLSADQQIEVEAVPSQFNTYMLFNCGKAPFNDPLVRQAVLYAIDRETITNTSFFGLAEPAWQGELPSDSSDYAQPEIIYSFDPGRARSLISQAGLTELPRVDILLYAESRMASQGPIIEQNLRDIGFEPNVIIAQDHGTRITDGDFDLHLLGSDPSIFAADAEFRLRWLYYGTVPRELAHLDDETAQMIEAALDKALTASTEEERKLHLAKTQDLIQALVPMAAIHRGRQITAWTDLDNFQPLPVGAVELDGVLSK